MLEEPLVLPALPFLKRSYNLPTTFMTRDHPPNGRAVVDLAQ
jgi:hypothetical protein